MKTTSKKRAVENHPPVQDHRELAALDIIRTETVLSRLPVHNLSNTGNVEINILRTAPDGQVELKWEVAPNPHFGYPRSLAYKLDTLVINRRIDELGRPLPKLICLGTLRDIAKELDLGGNTNKVRMALRQNASAFITAKFKYRTNDGLERSLEADFTRYSVVFSGELLPDGSKADAVYIVLNDPYREVVNNAPARPLDHAYRKTLPPSAQRFYEIVSYKIFSAIKNKYPYAKLAYSEYCTFSAQHRSNEWRLVRSQMDHVHQPHLKSGYLLKPIDFKKTTDPQGNPDWLFHYIPGPKARAEYAAAHRSKAADVESIEMEERLKRKTPAPPVLPPPPPPVDESMVAELVKRGIGEMESRKLLAKLAPGQPVLEQLEYADAVLRRPKNAIGNPQGFYISRLLENFPVPEHFETSAKRKLREEAEWRQREEFAERQALEIAYGEYRREEIDRYIAEHVPAQEFAALVKREKARRRAERGNLSPLPAQTLTAIAERSVRSSLAEQLPIPLLTIDEFRDREGTSNREGL
jgi:hypothetical protein